MVRVGIIVPTHGANPYLAATIASVVAQTFTDWTLVVVCDGATGESVPLTERMAAGDARIRAVRQPHAGVAAARNRGLRELRGRVDNLALLDHDDRWLPDTLATLVATVGDRRELVGAHGTARLIDAAGALVRPGKMESNLRRRRGVEGGRLVDWPPARPTGFANLVLGSCIPVGTALVRADAFERVGDFDERAVPADDYDMWLRLSRLGDFVFVDQVVLEYRQHVTPTWIRPHGVGRGAPYVRRKGITSPLNTPLQAAQARQGFRICETWVASDALAQAGRLASRGHLAAAGRQVLRAGLHLGAGLSGAPGWWHR